MHPRILVDICKCRKINMQGHASIITSEYKYPTAGGFETGSEYADD